MNSDEASHADAPLFGTKAYAEVKTETQTEAKIC